MISEVRIGFCPHADTTSGAVIPIFNSLNFVHVPPCPFGWSFSSESVDASFSRELEHALRPMHVAAISTRTRFLAL